MQGPGVPPPQAVIPLSAPALLGNEWRYVKECLDTNWVSSVGPFVDRFEAALAEAVGTKFAVATASGTAALHIALLVAGVEPDDEVMISTLTFIAPANTIRYVGGWPVFVDAEPAHFQMDVERVLHFLEHDCSLRDGRLVNRASGRRVRAILPVHLLGHPVDIDPLLEVAAKYDLAVIEDATESLGAQYKGRAVGHLGDIACFSFNGNKIITTGGGGMIVTDNQAWARRAKYLTTQAKDHPLEYIHNAVGYNYRLTNLQAALGCAQMENLARCVADKRQTALRYDAGLRDVPGLRLMREAAWVYSTFWLYTMLVDEAAFGMDSRELLRQLEQAGIQSRPLWQPIHLSQAHRGSQVLGGGVSEQLYRTALSLPCSVGLSPTDLLRVVEAVRRCSRKGVQPQARDLFPSGG